MGDFKAIPGRGPNDLGQKPSSESISVVFASDAPSSGVTDIADQNGHHIAITPSGQTEIHANQLPPSLGQDVAAASLSVVLASNQPAVAVTAASLPLPAGASTAAKQDTGNTSLASIDSKITTVNTGAVVVSSSALPTGAATAANQTTGNTSLSSIDTKTPALVTGRVPVDGSGVTQPISATALPLPAGASTSANQTTANASLSSIDGKIVNTANGTKVDVIASALPNGAATSALQSTGNATLSTIANSLPNTQGQRPSTTSFPVVLASDQSSIPVAFASGAYVTSTRTDFSGTTLSLSTWTVLVASTAAAVNNLTIFMSSGVTLELGIGGSGSEVRTLIIPPGGFDAPVPIRFATASRITVRAVDTVPTTGFLTINYIA